VTHAQSIEELEPVLAMCRGGRVFELQEWVRAGRPVALPVDVSARFARRNPIRVASDAGFHTIVQILLEAGASVRHGNYVALEHSVSLRRADVAELLIEHGASVHDVSMRHVIETWDPAIVDIFISHGASLSVGAPIAWGLVHKIKPTLGLLKRLLPSEPALMRQADLALRFHAAEGNAKWVSLLLWAGADPWSNGPDRLDSDEPEWDDGSGPSAVDLAAMTGHLGVFLKKNVVDAPDLARPETFGVLVSACHALDADALSTLLARGYSPRLLPDRGSGAIQSLLYSMTWNFAQPAFLSAEASSGGVDSERARERMKMLHLLVASGGRWLPGEKAAIGDARKSLLKMKPAYTLEFLWILGRYQAARRTDVSELLRPPSMARLLGHEKDRALSLVAEVPEQLPDDHA